MNASGASSPVGISKLVSATQFSQSTVPVVVPENLIFFKHSLLLKCKQWDKRVQVNYQDVLFV